MKRKYFFKGIPAKEGNLALENTSASEIINVDVYRFWASIGLSGVLRGPGCLRGPSRETDCPAEAPGAASPIRGHAPGLAALGRRQAVDRGRRRYRTGSDGQECGRTVRSGQHSKTHDRPGGDGSGLPERPRRDPVN